MLKLKKTDINISCLSLPLLINFFNGGTALAQQQGVISGPSFSAPAYSSIDSNGVDLLSGRFITSSPKISMGGEGNLSEFYLTWRGQIWQPNTPKLYLDKDWHIIIEFDGTSEEFYDAQKSENKLKNIGQSYTYKQKSPNIGSSLNCYFTGGLSGKQWISFCGYTSRYGVTISFYGLQPYNGGYPPNSLYDHEQFGNAGVWPYGKFDPTNGLTYYIQSGSLQTQIWNSGGDIKVDWSNGISLSKVGNYNSKTVKFELSNKSFPATNPLAKQTMTISTPNIDPENLEHSYLHPKSTTQTFETPDERITSYKFDGSGDLIEISSPSKATIYISYYSDHRVKTFKVEDSTWTYNYDFDTNSKGSGTTTVTYPDLKNRKISHLRSPGPVTSVTDQLNNTTSFEYDSNDRLISKKDPSGIITTYHYTENRGNLDTITTTPAAINGQKESNISQSASYKDKCDPYDTEIVRCNKPDQILDGRNSITEISYYKETGAQKAVIEPTGNNGVRPVKRYNYVQRYAWVQASNGGFTKSFYPMLLLSEDRTCRSTETLFDSNGDALGCKGGDADEVVTSYDYGPDTGSVGNNLWLRGKVVTAQDADGVIRSYRTCYGYDAAGNKIWETSPRADLSACY